MPSCECSYSRRPNMKLFLLALVLMVPMLALQHQELHLRSLQSMVARKSPKETDQRDTIARFEEVLAKADDPDDKELDYMNRRVIFRMFVNTGAELWLSQQSWLSFASQQVSSLLEAAYRLREPGPQLDAFADLLWSRANARSHLTAIYWTWPLWTIIQSLTVDHKNFLTPNQMLLLNKTTPIDHEFSQTLFQLKLALQEACLDKYRAVAGPGAEQNLIEIMDKLIDDHIACSHTKRKLEDQYELDKRPSVEWARGTEPMCQDAGERVDLIRDYFPDKKFVRRVIQSQLKVQEKFKITPMERLKLESMDTLEKLMSDLGRLIEVDYRGFREPDLAIRCNEGSKSAAGID